MKRVPVAGPWITQKENDAVADAAANVWHQETLHPEGRLLRPQSRGCPPVLFPPLIGTQGFAFVRWFLLGGCKNSLRELT